MFGLPRVSARAANTPCEEEGQGDGEQAAGVPDREPDIGTEREATSDDKRHPRQADERAADERRDEQYGSGGTERRQPRAHGGRRDRAGLPEVDSARDEYNAEHNEERAPGVAGHRCTIANLDEVSSDSFTRPRSKLCHVRGVRVLATVVAMLVGMSAPALAEIDASKIEKARDTTLTPTFQEDLPGYEFRRLGEFTLGDPGSRRGNGSGSGSGSGSGVAEGGGSQTDPRMRNRPNREGARRIDTREYQERERAREEAGPVSGLLTMFMWGLIAVGAGLLIFWFVSEMAKGDSDVALPAEDDSDAAVKAATAAIIDKPLGDADDLAARGEYAEAIHTLLLRTLHELARNAAVRVERSHTSREILRRVPLATDAEEALSMLITYVELTHFGDDPANAADYAKCREQFNRFATAFRAGLAIAKDQPQKLMAGGGTSL
jgi:hypothetical protein